MKVEEVMSLSNRSVRNIAGIIGFTLVCSIAFGTHTFPPNPFKIDDNQEKLDTIPFKDRYGDFVNDSNYNPFDITPSSVVQEVEYDPETNQYIILEKIGNEYYRNPTYMTFEEYLEWRGKQQEQNYFNRLAGFDSGGIKSGKGKLDPIAKLDIKESLIGRLFGGTEVTVQPQGNIDVTMGFDYNKNDNPTLLRRQRVQGPFFDFDMAIRMNVEGSIGKKLNLGFNYDTQASFDFDQKIKIAYDTQQFSEDDIIKSIEAGDVSMPLNSQLIQGSQKLFGLKTELQFGHLRLTLLASQQRTKQDEIVIEGGALVQEFEVTPDEYDENRHFFLSHYHRRKFEGALKELPYIDSQFSITDIEVWITNDTDREVEQSRMICAVADIAKSSANTFEDSMSMFKPFSGGHFILDKDRDTLPVNGNNEIYERLIDDESTRLQSNTAMGLTGPNYRMKQTRDFEIFRGRLLSDSEYTYNEKLGFISLNVRLRPNQVLGVSYKYNYTYQGMDTLYQVGQMTTGGNTETEGENGEPEPDNVLYVKMIKSSNQRVKAPSWDLMMKNVYALGASGVGREDFKFDIFYEGNPVEQSLIDTTKCSITGSLKRFLPEPELANIPLLSFFQLDRLNSQLDPQSDGIFDFMEGVTIIPRNGAIIFPVLEPFGSDLADLFIQNVAEPADRQRLIDEYVYTDLYDESVTKARERLERNQFVMKGEYKSSISSEISLGAFNIPQGSVVVRAGGQILKEGIDYDIDYGIGRIKIINDAYLQSGTPIRVSFEDQSLFSLQQKTMLGVRADYAVNEKLNIGATYMRLYEKPYTQKVNIGDDPINNRMFGIDLNYASESEFITKAIDKLPFYSTKEPSSIAFTGEMAFLKPSHNKAINNGEDGGIVSIDDFEGAGSAIPLGSQVTKWALASTPAGDGEAASKIPGGDLNNDLRYGANRALLNWYRIDFNTRSTADRDDPYTRTVFQTDLYKNREIAVDQNPDLVTFDLSYFPNQRGPYNFDTEEGYPGFTDGVQYDQVNRRILLNNPEKRWAGIMREIDNNDFEAANIEYLEFWMLNPFMNRRDGEQPVLNEEGMMYIHLGNVSEDILKDNLQMYENSIPTESGVSIPTSSSNWADVPIRVPSVIGFDADPTKSEKQDLGFDGLTDQEEIVKFADYLSKLPPLAAGDAAISNDLANDNYVYYGDPSVENEDILTERYRKFNNPQGNRPDGSVGEERGFPRPDVEDLNGNRSLDQGESYYEYGIPIYYDEFEGAIDYDAASEFIRDTIHVDATGQNEIWYRFQIPIDKGTSVNGIEGQRSIQFMRMLFTGFESAKVFRFADFEFVRNQWRTLESICKTSDGTPTDISLTLDDVSEQENAGKLPFNYIKPDAIVEERFQGANSSVRQDEKSLALQIENLFQNCEAAIYKNTRLDLRVFDKLQLFVHKEIDEGIDWDSLNGDQIELFIRVGKDYAENYYEYAIPLIESTPGIQTSENIWPERNFVDFRLEWFKQLKIRRNEQGSTDPNLLGLDLSEFIGDPTLRGRVSIVGNPSLGFVKGIQIGLRNVSENASSNFSGEVWINDLRVVGLEERGGWAGLARLDMTLADLGSFTSSASYSSIGFGAIDQKLDQRAKEEKIDYDFATNLELGKFFPSAWNISVPFYAQYAKSISKPQYDPFELDLTVDETIESYRTGGKFPEEELAEITDRANDVTTIKTINFTNVKKNRGSGSKKKGGDKPKSGTAKKKKAMMPWDLSNFSASYSYTETEHKDPLIRKEKTQDYKGALDYNYSRKANFVKPFKKVKSKNLKFIKEFNFNPLPNSFSVNNQLRRFKNQRVYRDPDVPVFAFDDLRFDWERRYNLKWDFSRSLKFSFTATNLSVIDELKQVGVQEDSSDPGDRKWVDEYGEEILDTRTYSEIINDDPNFVKEYRRNSLKAGGRNKDYRHNMDLSYTLPLKYIPGLDWISSKASYKAGYSWTAAPLSVESILANIIQNNQDIALNATFSFDKLYNKSKYLKSINRGPKRSKSKQRSRDRNKKDLGSKDKKEDALSSDKENTGRKRNAKKSGPSTLERALIRPLLLLRDVKFSYKQQRSTVVPGFSPDSEYLGLGSGFGAPGWDFIAGVQPNISVNDANNWLQRAGSRGWITTSDEFNEQVAQNKSETYDLKIDIEPYKDLKIDLDFKKTYRIDHLENFRNVNIDPDDPAEFEQLARLDVGSFDVTYSALNTLFGTDVDELFADFKQNRNFVSSNLAAAAGQNAGEIHSENQNYAQGFGPTSSEVIVPAFLATYTGKSVHTLDYNDMDRVSLERQISNRFYIPRPNWTIKYRGLSKLPVFSDFLQSFEISHGYKSTLKVARFNSNQEFIDGNNRVEADNGDYYSRIEIPQVVIDEQFSPLIGIKIKTKSDLNFDLEYRKSRNLALSIEASSLKERRSTEISVGFGYTFTNVNIGFLTGDSKKKKKRRPRNKDEDTNEDGLPKPGKSTVNNNRGKELILNFALSFRDDVNYDHRLSAADVPAEKNRGTKSISISPSIDYNINENFTLRLFVDYNKTSPYVTTSYPNTNIQGGLTGRFTIN